MKKSSQKVNDKKITNTARLILQIWNVGLFALVWIFYYNKIVFWNPVAVYNYRSPVYAAVIIFIYFVMYKGICSVYKAFRFASTSLFDLVFAHFVAFGLADLFCFIEGCLIAHRFLNILPGVIIVVIQLVGTAIIAQRTKARLMKRMTPNDTVVIYGSLSGQEDVESFIDRLMEKYEHLYKVSAVISDKEDIEKLIREIDQHGTVILFNVRPETRRDLIKICAEYNKEFLYDPRIEDIICEGCSARYLLDTPLMKYDFPYKSVLKAGVKRFWDIFMSLLLLVVLSPVMLITAIAIKAEDGGPVFYKQKRYTKDERIFDILKFRSMVVNAATLGVTPSTRGDPRVTKVGKIIRAARIDEIPQLINKLKGDMSFVGPRPERVEHVDLYSRVMPEFKYRLKVRGGLTGYAQVYGKYNTTPYDKLRLDLIYIENQSFFLDLKIFLLTIRTVFQKEATEGFDEAKSSKINSEVKEKQISHKKNKDID